MVAEFTENLNINTLIALGALAVAAVAVFVKISDKSVSLREHLEFKSSIQTQLVQITRRQEERLVIREFKEWREQINRDFDRLEEDLRLIDDAKPSAETLQEAMKAVDARVTHLEQMIRMLRNGNKT